MIINKALRYEGYCFEQDLKKYKLLKNNGYPSCSFLLLIIPIVVFSQRGSYLEHRVLGVLPVTLRLQSAPGTARC